MNKKLILKYSFFAFISIIVNLVSQELIYNALKLNLFLEVVKTIEKFSNFSNFIFYTSMLGGTFFGLLTKYMLDKKYIFYYKVKSKKDDLSKFIMYTFMGIITTFIFWGFEIAFKNIFDFYIAKYIGGLIGLTIGYTVKYFLDKRFVFRV